MSEKKVVISSGLTFPTLLFLVFLVLKLTNYINWSWWWVTAPLWATPVVFVGILLIVALIAFMIFVFSK